jgi:hypothetical protein
MKFRAIPGAFVVFAVGVGCSATSPLPGPLLSGPRLAEQGTLAARLFDEEVRLTYLPLRDNGTTPSNRVLTSDWALCVSCRSRLADERRRHHGCRTRERRVGT